jgi:hypothetical protein
LEDKSDAAISSCMNRQWTENDDDFQNSYRNITNSFLNEFDLAPSKDKNQVQKKKLVLVK